MSCLDLKYSSVLHFRFFRLSVILVLSPCSDSLSEVVSLFLLLVSPNVSKALSLTSSAICFSSFFVSFSFSRISSWLLNRAIISSSGWSNLSGSGFIPLASVVCIFPQVFLMLPHRSYAFQAELWIFFGI